MNRLSDIIEMGGNLYEEAWNIGRREALKEVNGGKYEMLEEANRNLGAQIDNYERNRYEASKEIDRLTAKVKTLDEENDRLLIDNNDLRKRLEWADAKVKELNEALETNQEKEAGRKPCTHGNVCRAYMREAHCILRQACPSGCEFYKPKEVSDELGQS